MKSLRLRLLALTSLLLTVSFALLGGVIDRSFLAALDEAQRDLLDSQIITLLAVAEPSGERTLELPFDLPEQRLNAPGSGLYGRIRDRDGDSVWQSRSAVGIDFTPVAGLPEAGERRFLTQTTSTGETLLSLTLGVIWEFDDQSSAYFALSVAESRASLDAQLKRFRGQLYLAFAAIALVLLVSVAILLSFLLRPLGRIAQEIQDVEGGQREALSANYPSELTGVARNLNTLLDSEAKRATRYQQTLANLAHSLKTPLAAAQNLLGDKPDGARIREQLARMQSIISYQLSRPAALGGRLMGRGAVDVSPEVAALLSGLDKVYRDKGVSAEFDIANDVRFRGDKGDLVELLGNLLDNAYKWCERHVLVSAENFPVDVDGVARTGLRLIVEDDGPGIAPSLVESALQRGKRLDESMPGTGIGLAVANDIVALYDGTLSIERAQSGGARIVATLPG